MSLYMMMLISQQFKSKQYFQQYYQSIQYTNTTKFYVFFIQWNMLQFIAPILIYIVPKIFTCVYHIMLCVALLTNTIWKILYRLKLVKSDCHINPYRNTDSDVFLHPYQFAKHSKCEFQIHQAETQDGSYVSLWRVKPKDQTRMQSSNPILLVHGLLDCSMTWFIHLKREACFPFTLAQEGFDVWIGNNRGTKFSNRNFQNKGYWNYTIDDMAKYDQPALINKVLKQTGKQKLNYVGHSQGATQFFISQGINPQLQSKVSLFFGMGTVVSLTSLQNHKLLRLFDKSRLLQILIQLGFECIFDIPMQMAQRLAVLTYNFRFMQFMMLQFIQALCGESLNKDIHKQRIGIMMAQQPGGSSAASLLQWLQSYRYGKIRKFDYGKKQNIQRYGSQTPPQYALTHMRQFPYNCHIYRGTRDALISDKDFDCLIYHFNPDRLTVHLVKDYTHLDYVWSQSAPEDIYKGMAQTITQEQKQVKQDIENSVDIQ